MSGLCCLCQLQANRDSFALTATPWDEPSDKCAEFRAHLEGKLLGPWNTLPNDVRGENLCVLLVEVRTLIFFSPSLGLILGLLEVDPKKRLSCSEVRTNAWFNSKNPLLRDDGLCADPQELAKRLNLKLGAPPSVPEERLRTSTDSTSSTKDSGDSYCNIM